jgi:hypothetical protein
MGELKMRYNGDLIWQLERGRHNFPTHLGGTCLTEAAVIAAGFKYRRISFPSDAPCSFSRALVMYAIGLNDAMPDYVRQRYLTPFVIRLAGTSDTREVESKRADFMFLENVRRFYPKICREVHRPYLIEKCRLVKDIHEARSIALELREFCNDQNLAALSELCSEDVCTAECIEISTIIKPSFVAGAAVKTVTRFADYFRRKSVIYGVACTILRDAILLGRHQQLDVKVALDRLRKTMEGAAKVEEIVVDAARDVEQFPVHETKRVLEPA